MRLYTMLLVACLTTVPAVAADEPVPGCNQTDYGLHCEGGIPPTQPVNQDPQSQNEACPPVTYKIQTQIYPVDVDVELSCIVQI